VQQKKRSIRIAIKMLHLLCRWIALRWECYSESAHKYVILGTPTWTGSRTTLTSTGKAFITNSTFTVKVASNNTDVRLARILDFGIANQKLRFL